MNTFRIRLIVSLTLLAFHCSSSQAAPGAPIPRYFAKAVVEVTPSDSSAEQTLRAYLPKNDSLVTLEAIPNTSLFSIGVHDHDPHVAAKRANEIAVSIQGTLGSEAKPKLLKIWEKAEPPAAGLRVQDANPSNPPPKPARSASPYGDFDMGAIYGQLIDGILTQLAKPETAAKLARFQRQHFDALLKEGFTNEEALKIVTSTHVPLSGASK